MQTKIKRTFFKVDAQNPTIFIEVCIYFNNKLSSKKAMQRPFMFTMPLNFSQKEQFSTATVTFDASKVAKVIKIEDFKASLLKNTEKITKSISEESAEDLILYGKLDHDFK